MEIANFPYLAALASAGNSSAFPQLPTTIQGPQYPVHVCVCFVAQKTALPKETCL
jgi:hypothetical protein